MPLVEYVALQAEEADIEFSIGDEDTDIPDENMIDALVDSLLLGATPEEPSLPPMEEDMDVPEESMGLMRKRSI